MPHDLIAQLGAIAGADHVLTGAAAAPYCTDWRGRYRGDALAVVLPADAQQVSAVVQLCAARKIAVVPQGGNTSLCGASVPLAALSGRGTAAGGRQPLAHEPHPLHRCRQLHHDGGSRAASWPSLYTAAEQANRLFPLGLTAIAPHCEIGGNLSTNAGGIGVLRYGNARDLVLGLEVVLPDGRIWNGLRSLRKDNTGYDLKHLFIGAEGTLGIITAAVLKLFPRPQSTATACIAVRDAGAAVELLAHLRARCGDTISAFEIISRSCLDLVFKHIPGAHEPFAEKFEWIIIAQLSDVLPHAAGRGR